MIRWTALRILRTATYGRLSMKHPAIGVSWLALAACALCAAATPAVAQPLTEKARSSFFLGERRSKTSSRKQTSATLPITEMPAGRREAVCKVIDQPTVCTKGPREEFPGRALLYHWMLDHPDRAAQAWLRLGMPCLEICDRGNGQFGWCDGEGTEVQWETVYCGPDMRIWYAEGVGKAGPLLAHVPVRAVVVLRYGEYTQSGRTLLHHQAELFMQTDSKTAVILTKLLGPAVPRLAGQCIHQLETFYSGLSWYLDKHPDRVGTLLAKSPP